MVEHFTATLESLREQVAPHPNFLLILDLVSVHSEGPIRSESSRRVGSGDRRENRPTEKERKSPGKLIAGPGWPTDISRYDIGCALERQTSPDCVGYAPDSALRIATAVVRYHARP